MVSVRLNAIEVPEVGGALSEESQSHFRMAVC
jgi:hypothetical protein